MEFLQDFILETREHLETIEMDVLNLETDPENNEIINSLFRAFHTVKGLAGFVDQTLIQELAHQTETILDDCRKGTLKATKSIINLILDSADYIGEICNEVSIINNPGFIGKVEEHLNKLGSIDVHQADNHTILDDEPEGKLNKRIGEILVELQKINQDELEELLKKQNLDYPSLKLGEIAIKEKKIKARDVLNGIREQNKVSKLPELDNSYIRVSTSKVDNLVNMIGELIISQAQLEQETRDIGASDTVMSTLMNISRITRDIQYQTMSLRMVSLRPTFQKITRIARDTIEELQKDVVFNTEGEETEIDRNIAEKLLEPLVHLIKNAIYHGIESKGEREKSGKNLKGQVTVTAYSKRGNVYIEVSDDGRGIDKNHIYQKALEKKLIDGEKTYSEKEILDFIFMPGLSTAKGVDQISGRGVGMDVVKTEIYRIGGRIEINNRVGKGCTFILKIPINLAVMNGTIVEIGQVKYIIPTLNVKQILQVGTEHWVEIKGRRSMVRVRDEIIPVIPIKKTLGCEVLDDKKKKEDDRLVIVLEMEKDFKALPVDNIVDRREIVVKPLGEEFAGLNYVSGASILGDGKVSLIFDIEYLFKMEGVV